MMKQYKEIKNKYKDYIVFFRLGDFYEMFYDDAKIASRELEIALTSRDPENKVPMAGVPYHAATQYIYRLISRGYKVVICEQVEDPNSTKKIIKREVVKIITPGTITDIDALEEKKNNFLGCIYKYGNNFGLAFVDLMTGEFFSTELKSNYPYQELINELYKFQPRECLINFDIENELFLKKAILDDIEAYITYKDEDYFNKKAAHDMLESHIAKEKNFDTIDKEYSTIAAGACLKYLTETQNSDLSHINSIQYYEYKDYMVLDLTCRKNLELTQSLKDKGKVGTLLWVLDNTVTSMGARLLRKWVEQPLIDIIKIKDRQDSVEEFLNDFFLREELKEQLKDIYDIERLTGKLVCGNLNARDLLAIKNTIKKFPKIKMTLGKCKTKLLKLTTSQIDKLDDVYELLEKSINDDPPLTVKDGNIIKFGFNPEIDKLRKASKEGKAWIADLEKKERERTNIKSLKVGFNKVFGYYIEVTKSNLELVPNNYIRKQTLANCERYITEELKDYESLILNCEQKLQNLEYEVFCHIRDELINHIPRLKRSAYSISVIDALLSLAITAYKHNFIKPEITLKDEILITQGRHPVVEQSQKEQLFIPNDTYINCTDSMISIITGPNMAGKSTFMRQVALIVLMAQIGSFVPAKNAQIGIVDKIFTRIGASDDLASGQSTFMVEMTEMAHILNNATKKSLLILDEVGRGTSTFDGISIAWAIIEYIQKNIGAKTLFATHYHELTELKNLYGIKNFKVTVKEKGDNIIFLRKIVHGEADKSYGIQVARLAGLPNTVISRARKILEHLEEEKKSENTKDLVAASSDSVNQTDQVDIDFIQEKEIISEIKSIDIDTLTPLEALNFLFSIKQKLL